MYKTVTIHFFMPLLYHMLKSISCFWMYMKPPEWHGMHYPLSF